MSYGRRQRGGRTEDDVSGRTVSTVVLKYVGSYHPDYPIPSPVTPQCLQAITNVALTTLDARDNTPARVRAREYLNHFTMALALFTVSFDAIRAGFGLDVKPTMQAMAVP